MLSVRACALCSFRVSIASIECIDVSEQMVRLLCVFRSLLLGESASPFIDKENGLTSERGRVYVS